MKKLLTISVIFLTVLLIGCVDEPVRPDDVQPQVKTEFVPLEAPIPTPEPTPEPVPEPEPSLEPCPLTDEEYRLLAELMTCEAQVVVWGGEKWGVSPYCRIAAVAWTAFNRLDAGYGETIEEVIKAPY